MSETEVTVLYLSLSEVFNLFLFPVNVYDFFYMSRNVPFFQRLDKFYYDNFLGMRILNLIFNWGLFQLHREHHS